MSVLTGLRNEDDEQYVIKMKAQPARESIEETLSAVWSALSCLSVQAILRNFDFCPNHKGSGDVDSLNRDAYRVNSTIKNLNCLSLLSKHTKIKCSPKQRCSRLLKASEYSPTDVVNVNEQGTSY
jgi:hypothetical protein